MRHEAHGCSALESTTRKLEVRRASTLPTPAISIPVTVSSSPMTAMRALVIASGRGAAQHANGPRSEKATGHSGHATTQRSTVRRNASSAPISPRTSAPDSACTSEGRGSDERRGRLRGAVAAARADISNLFFWSRQAKRGGSSASEGLPTPLLRFPLNLPRSKRLRVFHGCSHRWRSSSAMGARSR